MHILGASLTLHCLSSNIVGNPTHNTSRERGMALSANNNHSWDIQTAAALVVREPGDRDVIGDGTRVLLAGTGVHGTGTADTATGTGTTGSEHNGRHDHAGALDHAHGPTHLSGNYHTGL